MIEARIESLLVVDVLILLYTLFVLSSLLLVLGLDGQRLAFTKWSAFRGVWFDLFLPVVAMSIQISFVYAQRFPKFSM